MSACGIERPTTCKFDDQLSEWFDSGYSVVCASRYQYSSELCQVYVAVVEQFITCSEARLAILIGCDELGNLRSRFNRNRTDHLGQPAKALRQITAALALDCDVAAVDLEPAWSPLNFTSCSQSGPPADLWQGRQHWGTNHDGKASIGLPILHCRTAFCAARKCAFSLTH
jgi:hypothetical protein